MTDDDHGRARRRATVLGKSRIARPGATVAVVCASLAHTACGTTHVPSGQAAAGTTPAAAPARPGTIPAGTSVRIRLNETVDADAGAVGDHFTAAVVEPVTAGDGSVLVPVGAIVRGHISGIERSPRTSDAAALALDVDTIQVGADSSALAAEVVAATIHEPSEPAERRIDTGAAAGVGAAAGALLGLVLGGWRGAVVGGVVGGGTGTVIALGAGEVEPKLPAGTELSLLTTAVTRLPSFAGTSE